MKKSPNANVENAGQSEATVAVLEQPAAATVTNEAAAAVPSEAAAAAADRAAKLKAAQDKAAAYLREQRYEEAKRALEEAEDIQAVEANIQRVAAAQAERERAITLTNEGKYTEAKQALERADELEAKGAGWTARRKQFFASVRSRLPERLKAGDDDQTESADLPAAAPVTESLRIVNKHSKIAAAVGLLPGGFVNFAAVLAVQILMVRRIARAFGHKGGNEQIRGLILSLIGALIPVGIGQSAGLALASIPAMVAGAVVYFVATPILAYAMTRAVGNVFIMHFESGGTLLTFDPKAFTEYFVSEFKKAGGTLRRADEPAPTTSAPAA